MPFALRVTVKQIVIVVRLIRDVILMNVLETVIKPENSVATDFYGIVLEMNWVAIFMATDSFAF